MLCSNITWFQITFLLLIKLFIYLFHPWQLAQIKQVLFCLSKTECINSLSRDFSFIITHRLGRTKRHSAVYQTPCEVQDVRRHAVCPRAPAPQWLYVFPRAARASLREHGLQPGPQRHLVDPAARSGELRALLAGHPPHDLRGQRADLRDGAERTLLRWPLHDGHQDPGPRSAVCGADGAGGGVGFDACHTTNETTERNETSRQ